MVLTRYIFSLGAILVLFGGEGHAHPVLFDSKTTPLDPRNTSHQKQLNQKIAKYDAYLQNLRTFRASFTQLSPKGVQTKGVLYVQKPGKLRVIYEPAETSLQLISDGSRLVQYDGRTQESDSISLKETPLYFFLNEGSLQKYAVLRSAEFGPRYSALTLSNKEDPEAGSIILIFSEKPTLRLVQWVLVDADGARTQVTLSNIQTNLSIAPQTFRLTKR